MPSQLKWLPAVDADRCIGCGQCVQACPSGYRELSRLVAILREPDPCLSDGACVGRCPTQAIRMQWLEFSGNPAIGTWREP
jgi:ferredoxin